MWRKQSKQYNRIINADEDEEIFIKEVEDKLAK